MSKNDALFRQFRLTKSSRQKKKIEPLIISCNSQWEMTGQVRRCIKRLYANDHRSFRRRRVCQAWTIIKIFWKSWIIKSILSHCCKSKPKSGNFSYDTFCEMCIELCGPECFSSMQFWFSNSSHFLRDNLENCIRVQFSTSIQWVFGIFP